MEEQKYNLGSPEIIQFLNLNPEHANPLFRQEYARTLASRLGPADVSSNYESVFAKQGIQADTLKHLKNYIDFDIDWKSQKSIDAINQLTEIAQSNPSVIYSYSTKESPLYRGAKVHSSFVPAIGETFSFNRFKSFTPDIFTAVPFTKGAKPFDLNNPKSYRDLDPNKVKTLFQIQQEPSDKFNYLITQGAGEPEVLSRPSAKYLIEDKLTFPSNQREMGGNVQLIKLRQLYGVDPIGGAIQGGVNLVKQNIPGAIIGTGLSVLNPTVAEQIKKNEYKEAGKTIIKDVAFGALTEAGIKKIAPLAGKYAPAIINTASRIVAPVVTGGTLFTQGQPGSLTDVVTKKAAENPVSWLPSVKPNPKTDLGARASRMISNEAAYAFQKLLQGKIPYIGK